MPLEVGKPVLDPVARVHTLSITDCPPFQYVTAITDRVDLEAVPEQFTTFITVFLQKASKYFSQPIDTALFTQRIQHTYEGEENESGEDVQVSWIPAFVLFYPNRYVIHWKLVSTENPPGKADIIEPPAAPSPTEPLQSTSISPVRTTREIRKKIRQARLKAAVAKLYLQRLTQKYYEKYGNFSGLEESESELSSESDDE